MRPGAPRQKRWVVREGDGGTIAEILRRAGEGERAVDEGRVFLGRKRVTRGTEVVRPGDEVRIGGAGPAAGAWSVIWEREGLVACFKPAGMPTVADHVGASHALVALAAEAVGRSAGEMFVTSRLDREVSGVVVFATTPEAEARLRTAREEGRYTRRYVAIATGAATRALEIDSLINVDKHDRNDQCDQPNQRINVWNVPIGDGIDPRHRAALGPDAKAAETRWAVVARAGGFSLLAVEPQTGRTHQIRIHASHAGVPLLGDRDYGGPTRTTLPDGRVIALSRIALHAARVSVPGLHGELLVAEAPVPAELVRAWTDLGGASEAWDTAVSCAFGR